MSYDEITRLVKEIDNLVCAEGITLFMWYLNEKEEFNDMIQSSHSLNNGLKDIWDYEDYLLNNIVGLNYKESKIIIDKHKELWLTLISKSELSCKYFTPNDDDLFRRLHRFGRMEVVIDLNKFNFISQEIFHQYEENKIIEMAGHRILSYVISWKKALIERYCLVSAIDLNGLQGEALYLNDSLDWNLDDKQLKQLMTLFKKFFLSTTGINSVIKILRCQEDGNIMWVKTTESLVYFFTSLVKMEYLQTKDWSMVLTRRIMFVSKQGKIINHRNINSSTYRVKQKGFTSKESKAINNLLSRFELIKS